MSVQAALDFMEKLNGDESLYAEVKTVPKGDIDALCQLAAGRGYDFDGDDLKGAVARVSGSLDEDELEEVAGGLTLKGGTPYKYSFSVPLVLKSFSSSTCGTGSCGDPELIG